MGKIADMYEPAKKNSFVVVMNMHAAIYVEPVEVLIVEPFATDMTLSHVISLKGHHMCVIPVRIIRKPTV
ncbi:MAG: hypothetical protein MR035_03700 [Dorea longicatena]|nr:hypothetical protein [Dorea longicatena]